MALVSSSYPMIGYLYPNVATCAGVVAAVPQIVPADRSAVTHVQNCSDDLFPLSYVHMATWWALKAEKISLVEQKKFPNEMLEPNIQLSNIRVR